LCCRTTQIYTVSSYTRVHTHTYTHVHTHTHAHVRTRSSSHVQARKQTSTQMSGGWTPTDAATSTFSSSAPTRGPTDLHQIKHYGDGTEGRLKDLRPCDSDTPIQRRMKLARLRRCDVLALILYTGVFAWGRAMRATVLVPPHCTLSLAQCAVNDYACSGESLSSSRTDNAHSSDHFCFCKNK